MLGKITTVAVMAFIASSLGGDVWTGFTAKWAEKPSDGFYQLPQNLEDAQSEGWTEISGVGAPCNVTALGYYGDPIFVLLFSDYSCQVIGLQVSMRVSDIENGRVPINYTDNPAIIKKTLNGEEYFTATAFFHQDEKAGTRKIQFQEQNGLLNIPAKSDLVLKLTKYTLDPCVPWMGVHFHYAFEPVDSCSKIYPWFLLGTDDNIIGIGFQAVGTTTPAPKRTWYESPSNVVSALRFIMPNAPSCLTEYAVKYGFRLFHIWFINNPLNINCTSRYTAVIESSYD